MSPSSINNMVTNERFVFFRHDDNNTNLSVANQSIIEDNESAGDDLMENSSRAGAFGSQPTQADKIKKEQESMDYCQN